MHNSQGTDGGKGRYSAHNTLKVEGVTSDSPAAQRGPLVSTITPH